MTDEATHTAAKERNGIVHINYVAWKVKHPFSAMFSLLHSSASQQLFEKHLCNQISHCTIMKESHHVRTTELTLLL